MGERPYVSKRVKQAVVVACVLVASSHSWSEELANRPRVRPLASVSIGLPAVVNGVIGVEAQHVGVRISGAYWGRLVWSLPATAREAEEYVVVWNGRRARRESWYWSASDGGPPYASASKGNSPSAG